MYACHVCLSSIATPIVKGIIGRRIKNHCKGDSKKVKLHYEVAAMAGHDVARCNLGTMEHKSGKWNEL